MATKVRGSARGGPVGWNLCKAQMKESIAELENTLDHGDEIPLKRRLALHVTLEKMKIAAAIVNKVGCSGPFMSFDLAYVMKSRRAAPTTTRKKR